MTTVDFTPPPTAAGRRRRRLRRGLVAAGAAVVTAGVATGAVLAVSGLHGCAAGVVRRGDECVGVTDGSYVFAPELSAAEARIAAENAAVADQPHVTVALLTPLTATRGGAVSIERIRSQLEGAYVAQHTANQQGANPRIRLALANMGSTEQAWEPVVDRLVGMLGAPDHLVAVAGLGVSAEPTVRAARALSRHGVPMVGAVITADALDTAATGLGGGPIPGLTRVNASVAEEVAVLGDYLTGQRPDLHTAMLVSDENSADLYTAALRRDFSDGPLARYWVAGGRVVQPYDGAPGTRGTDAQFKAIVANLCGVNPPDMVFYAGRASLLPSFVVRLRQRNCARTRTVTVVTGSDASNLRSDLPPRQRVDAPVSVLYAPLADPAALADPATNPDVAQYQRFATAFAGNGFPAGDLADGWAVMTHDAVLAATTAIERATGQSTGLPRPGEVRSLLYLANSPTTSVPGAGGTFTVDARTGDAVGRRVPVLELRPDGSLTVRAPTRHPASR